VVPPIRGRQAWPYWGITLAPCTSFPRDHHERNHDKKESKNCRLRSIKTCRKRLLDTPGEGFEPQHGHQAKITQRIQKNKECPRDSCGSHLGPGHLGERAKRSKPQCARDRLALCRGPPECCRDRECDVGHCHRTQDQPAGDEPVQSRHDDEPPVGGEIGGNRKGKRGDEQKRVSPSVANPREQRSNHHSQHHRRQRYRNTETQSIQSYFSHSRP